MSDVFLAEERFDLNLLNGMNITNVSSRMNVFTTGRLRKILRRRRLHVEATALAAEVVAEQVATKTLGDVKEREKQKQALCAACKAEQPRSLSDALRLSVQRPAGGQGEAEAHGHPM